MGSNTRRPYFLLFCLALIILPTSHAAVVVNTAGRSGVRVNDEETTRREQVEEVKDKILTKEVKVHTQAMSVENDQIKVKITTADGGVLPSATSAEVSLAMLELRAQRRSNLTVDAFFCGSNKDCVTCTKDTCDWCLWTNTCVSKMEITAECQFNKSVSLPPGSGAWLKTPEMCNLTWAPLIGDWSGFGMNLTGCTDANADNYMFMATVDNGGCSYAGHNGPSYFPQAYCICSTGGYSTPYGRFCGSGYTGGNGQQPCDRGDKCAQMHDWCVGQLGYHSCNCTVGLVKCMRYVQQCGDPGFCGTLQQTIKNVITEILPAFEICSSSTLPYCDDSINCSGHGTCSDYGQCECYAGWSGYMCDVARK